MKRVQRFALVSVAILIASMVSADVGEKVWGISPGVDVTIDSVNTSNAELIANGQYIFVTAAVTRTLPAVSPTGQSLCYYSNGANIVTIDPASTEVIVLNGTVLTGGFTIISPGNAGDLICLLSDGTKWYTLGRIGTWIAGS